MCGRFTLRVSPRELADEFGISEGPLFTPRYNIAPSQSILAVRLHDGQRHLVALRWGLIPHWAKDPKIAYQLLNARCETVSQKPAFRDAFRKRRCLIPADGFYEWKKVGKNKQPFHIYRRDGRLFAFAGLWDCWQPPAGEPMETCTIVTTCANELVAPLHDRMPVILEKPDYQAWLDAASTPEHLQALLRPLPADLMTTTAVSTRVNSPKNEDAECLTPAESGMLPFG